MQIRQKLPSCGPCLANQKPIPGRHSLETVAAGSAGTRQVFGFCPAPRGGIAAILAAMRDWRLTAGWKVAIPSRTLSGHK